MNFYFTNLSQLARASAAIYLNKFQKNTWNSESEGGSKVLPNAKKYVNEFMILQNIWFWKS